MPDHYPLFDTCRVPAGGLFRDPQRTTHDGYDLTPRNNDDSPMVPVMDDGTVIYANKGLGLNGTQETIVIVQHADYASAYGHLEHGSTTVRAGQRVSKYQAIGRMGFTGYTIPVGKAGKHVHIETYRRFLGSMTASKPYVFDPLEKLRLPGASPEQEHVTNDENFRNCFITQAGVWPNDDQLNAWRSSGLEAYAWVQRNAPNLEVEAAKRRTFREAYITVAQDWPSNATITEWEASGLTAYEWVQRHAPNPSLAAKEDEIRELHIKLESTELASPLDPTDSAQIAGLKRARDYLTSTISKAKKKGVSKQ